MSERRSWNRWRWLLGREVDTSDDSELGGRLPEGMEEREMSGT